MHCGAFLEPVAYLGFGKGGPWQARGARAYNGGLGAPPPAGSRSRAPGRGLRGQSPPEAETLFFWMFNGNCKFAHFSEIWKHKRPSNIVEFCNSCWKMAKNAPFHIKLPVKNFHGPAKGGGAIAPCPPPKYATDLNDWYMSVQLQVALQLCTLHLSHSTPLDSGMFLVVSFSSFGLRVTSHLSAHF